MDNEFCNFWLFVRGGAELFVRLTMLLLVALFARSASDEHNSDNESVKGEAFGKNHHKNEHNQDILLPVSAHTSVTNHTDCEASSQRGESSGESSGELLVAGGVVVVPGINGLASGGGNDFACGSSLELLGDNDGDNEAVDTQDTGHDHGDDRLEH